MVASVQVLRDTDKTARFLLTGTGAEGSPVIKINASTLVGATGDGVISPVGSERFEISSLEWSIQGGAAQLLWDATVDTTASILAGNGHSSMNIVNGSGAGSVGDLSLQTIGFGVTSTYNIIVEIDKKISYSFFGGV